jgi:hypothetical protein
MEARGIKNFQVLVQKSRIVWVSGVLLSCSGFPTVSMAWLIILTLGQSTRCQTTTLKTQRSRSRPNRENVFGRLVRTVQSTRSWHVRPFCPSHVP